MKPEMVLIAAIPTLGGRRQEDSYHTAVRADSNYCFLGQWLPRPSLSLIGSCVCVRDTNTQVRNPGIRSKNEAILRLAPILPSL